jgi:hypothetical protein
MNPEDPSQMLLNLNFEDIMEFVQSDPADGDEE